MSKVIGTSDHLSENIGTYVVCRDCSKPSHGAVGCLVDQAKIIVLVPYAFMVGINLTRRLRAQTCLSLSPSPSHTFSPHVLLYYSLSPLPPPPLTSSHSSFIPYSLPFPILPTSTLSPTLALRLKDMRTFRSLCLLAL